MQKSELLSWLNDQYQKWEALLVQIGEARMDQPGVNGSWSAKDTVAHLTGWNRRLVDCLQAALHGLPEPPPWPAHLQSDDDVNAWIYQANRDRSVRDVLDETDQVFQQLVAAIEGLPDDARIERVDPAYYLVWIGDQRFIASEFFDHFRDDHEPDMRAWMAQDAQP
jgi:hypothetical protein